MREFRGAWIATVNNSVWPSQKGLSTAEQKAELIALLDRAARLKLNAIIFQVRPACDALYSSTLEPWSEYLTGTMGQAPEPFYDPLAFAVAQAHQRGLELHAWFNPYRALHFTSKSPIATNHISKTRPDLVRKYGDYLWLDPGERDVQDHSLKVVMDVVKRYDVDGVHFDDYFYPYPEKDKSGEEQDFPDWQSRKRYGAGGTLSRDDWRRENVNTFVQRAYESVKAAKPWVQFGISPFGIWRPKNPPQIQGLDAYAKLYADARKWLANGWLDYCAPQLYWAIDAKEQSFPALLSWWSAQNVKDRHLWAGINSLKVGSGWQPEDIVNQIRLTRGQAGISGQIHWNLSALMNTGNKLGYVLAKEVYAQPALTPASPWLSTNAPGRPAVFLSGFKTGKLRLTCKPAEGNRVRLWVIQTKSDNEWKTEIVPGENITRTLGDFHPDAIAVTPIDRVGIAGKPVVYEKKN
jgi:uncharacterized lipoprotein YddW (UPF0748 family)